MPLIRDFINSKGTRYTRSNKSIAAQFKDYWVYFRKMPNSNMWKCAFHTPATGITMEFIVGDLKETALPPVVVWHASLAVYHAALAQEHKHASHTLH